MEARPSAYTIYIYIYIHNIPRYRDIFLHNHTQARPIQTAPDIDNISAKLTLYNMISEYNNV